MKTRFVKGLAAATILGVAAVPALSTGTAHAKDYDLNLDVMCTQPQVNGGAPFNARTDVTITLPDVIYSGDTVEPEVAITVTLPADVTDAIRGYGGRDQLSGTVKVVASVVDPAGEATELTDDSIDLPKTLVGDPGESFEIDTTGSFPDYTVGEAGTYQIVLSGEIVTVSGITLSDSQGNMPDATLPGDITCTIGDGTEVEAVDMDLEVVDPEPETTPTTTVTATATETVTKTVTKTSSPALPKTGS